MGGLFGVVSSEDCVADLFYGTDYHSHLGTMRGGLAVKNGQGFTRRIHDITNSQFRSKFEDDLPGLNGSMGIGVTLDQFPTRQWGLLQRPQCIVWKSYLQQDPQSQLFLHPLS